MKLKDILEGCLFTDGDWIESKDQDANGDIRLIQLSDIGDGYFVNKSKKFINEETARKLRCTFLRKDDILIARMPDPLGRACLFPFEENNKYITAVDVCILRPNDKCNNRYLQYCLNSPEIRSIINRQKTGTTRERITRKKLGELEIPFPSLKVQQKIVDILDTADILRLNNKTLLIKYDTLAQSIFLEMFGDPVKNEKGWKLENLKKITSKIGSGSTPSGGKDAYHEEGISLIRSLNIHDNFFKMKDLAFIDERQANKLKNVSLEKNDVLINITGASVARSTIVPDELLPARVNQHVSILRPKSSILNSVFLLHLLISPNSKAKLLGVSSQGGATREAITKDQLENFEIILPSIALQKQFAEKIALIEQQKELAKQELKESEDLFNCLLQKAFKGELV
ncbi:restriction endonuclease subunit S [Chryseobacterium sp. SNU WT5]|uniref:restriction endonuclease subunit S n=1 Tax=Chryseobacterium sp. SNU WT5 TaxID=2594269 RepID=UPI001180EEDF|nr:restriction endonuclease subunit S [Chryseobacterium sp. SNU WT5]QDP84598.1 restriction endonuclease subunit S [Chryseobacterium sp. SNU WT5]